MGVTASSTGTKDSSTLTIYIPDIENVVEYVASRAETPSANLADVNEAKIDNLWFFAYPVKAKTSGEGYEKDTSRERVIVELNNSNKATGETNTVPFNYTSYEVSPFQNGGYRIYVVANIKDYLPQNSELFTSGGALNTNIEEEKIREAILQFSTNNYLSSGKLPMACINTEIKGTGMSDDGVFTFNHSTATGKDLQEVYADMTFLCAKVRYTVLFNKNNSKNTFSGTVDFNDNDVTAYNVINSCSLTDDGNAIDGNPKEATTILLTQQPLKKKIFPNPDSQYLLTKPSEYEKDLEDYRGQINDYPEDQRAWQGVIYLPPNASLGDKRTKLHFSASGDEVNSEGYDLVLFEKEENTKLEKGKFYDVIAELTTSQKTELEIKLLISDWNSKSIDANLFGVTELEVQYTKLEINSGAWSEMWYYSNVPPELIDFNFPKLKGTQTDFYQAEIKKDEEGNYVKDPTTGYYLIQIRINPAITFEALNNIKKGFGGDNMNNYNYFEIKAGNLIKKIKLDLINIKGYLEIDPREIIIDVREYISSGTDKGIIEINIDSNVKNEVSYTAKNDSESIFTSNGALWLSAGEGTTKSSGTITLTQGTGKLILNLDKFFDGDEYWKTSHSYSFDFSVGDGDDLNKTLTITVKPYTTDYTIHFRTQGSAWDAPHIYVYQCLELPANLTTTLGGDTPHPYAGKTVGYNQDGTQFAGLEYMFSNDIAFRGWYGYGGVAANNPYDSYTTGGGFVIFNSFTYKVQDDTQSAHYDHEALFNENADVSACSQCANHGYRNQTFPGIVMERDKENPGWWKYTLSGIATPGKAMIMFSDTHNQNQSAPDKRYPANNQVGVPLFDYPDNEGWFDFTGNNGTKNQNFKDEKPPYYRFYWPYEYGARIHFYKDDNHKYTDWLTSCGTFDPSIGYFYYDMAYLDSGNLNYIFNQNDNTKKENVGTISDFVKVGDNYCAYITTSNSKLTGGVPKTSILPSTTNGSDQIYLRGIGGDWSASSKYQFQTIAGKSNAWKINNISITSGTTFKVADGSYNPLNLGSNGSDIVPNTSYILWSSNPGDIKMSGDFNNGTVYLLKDNYGNYILILYK